MTNLQAAQTDNLAEAVARWENEGGALSRPQSGKATCWFVPPFVVPALVIALIGARLVYQAYS